jgi:hypothetical protein
MLAGAAGTERIDIVTLTPHRHGELYGFDRAVLTDRLRKVIELADQIERQLRRFAGPVEQNRRKRSTGLEVRWAGLVSARCAIGARWSRSGQICIP